MQVKDLIRTMEEIAPTRFAESWDNTGLLVGDPNQSLGRILLTVDYTVETAREGKQWGCDAVLSYHPPIFKPLKRIEPGSVIHDAIERGVAIYSPHTALDVAQGGANDVLADVLGLVERAPLRPVQTKGMQCKLVTFVPEKDLEKVSAALFEAGAGVIGNYSSCSFQSPGTGTFIGNAQSNPSIGRSGRLERAAEVRLETVVPLPAVSSVVRALRQSHSYEEPAFDLQQLLAPPEAVGQGRIGNFAVPTAREPLLQRVKHLLELDHLLVAGPLTGDIRRAAVGAGSGGELLPDAISAGAELFLTGELRHHDALMAAAKGVTIVCTLHSNSERAALKRLGPRLQQALAGLTCRVSEQDRDPFEMR